MVVTCLRKDISATPVGTNKELFIPRESAGGVI